MLQVCVHRSESCWTDTLRFAASLQVSTVVQHAVKVLEGWHSPWQQNVPLLATTRRDGLSGRN